MTNQEDIRESDLADRLNAVLQLAPVPMLITDGEGRYMAANEAWAELTPPVTGGSAVADWTDCIEPAGRVDLARAMHGCARSGEPATLDLEMQGRSGWRWTRWWIRRQTIETTPVLVLVAVDVHDEVVQRDDLRQLATRDDLTGLVNRRVFLETVDQALRRVERFGEAAGVLYVDLDGFKEVNDQAGHMVGDLVLAHVAGRLREAVRSADVVGRIGGDEFAVVLERLTSPGEAAAVARRVEESLSGHFDAGGQTWSISASVGLALTAGPGDSAISLLASADREMYSAKRARTKQDITDSDPAT